MHCRLPLHRLARHGAHPGLTLFSSVCLQQSSCLTTHGALAVRSQVPTKRSNELFDTSARGATRKAVEPSLLILVGSLQTGG